MPIRSTFAGMPTGLVMRSTGSHYRVRGEDGLLHDLVAKGKLRIKGFSSTNPIAVGDRVVFDAAAEGTGGTVIEVLERKNYLVRRSVNLSHQKSVIAANIDQAMLMVTLASPRTSTGFIDRFLVTAEAYEIPCVLLLNKVDACESEELVMLDQVEQVYTSAGYRTLRTSGLTGQGLDEVKAQLLGKITLVSGHSGVGKSTLINAIDPGLDLRTAAISHASDKGQHTTTFAEMFEIKLGGPMGSFIIDTPGIKGFGLVQMDLGTIGDQFPEFLRLKNSCRFSSCTHLHEPGCAVLAALERGEVAESRYRSYVDMVNGADEDGSYRRD